MRRLLSGLFLLLAACAVFAQSPQPAAPSLAGKVELVEGEVTVFDRAKKPRQVAVGDRVHEGEGIVTGRNGELHLAMEDGGFIAVRPDTKMSIAAYRAEGDDRDKSVFSLLEGTFRSVTGWIGKFNPRSYQVRTPTATIGVRGTDHEPLVIPQGATAGEPGSYDKVNVGATTLQTRHGSVEVRPNQAGFAPLRGKPRPRVLTQVPAFFKATRHEPAIAARHETIRKLIDERREERRKVLLEKKTQLDKQKAERQKAIQERRREQEAQRRQQGEERRQQRQEALQQRRLEREGRGGELRERRSGDGPERRQRMEERRGRRDGSPRGPDSEHETRGGGRLAR
ncbi:MAG: FecR domain-containing protein [Rhodocyclaceae bacterium]|nr:FecR domain-containing protein [Rhodocyclaceae bacterium]